MRTHVCITGEGSFFHPLMESWSPAERVHSAMLTAINDVHLAWTENQSLMSGENISREHYHARLQGHCERAYKGLQAALKELNPALSPPSNEESNRIFCDGCTPASPDSPAKDG